MSDGGGVPLTGEDLFFSAFDWLALWCLWEDFSREKNPLRVVSVYSRTTKSWSYCFSETQPPLATEVDTHESLRLTQTLRPLEAMLCCGWQSET